MRWVTALLFGLVCVGAAFAEDATVVDAAQDFDTKWNYGDPAATEQVFRKMLETARAKDKPDREYVGQLLTQIARTHSLRNSFDDAHKLLDEATKVLGDSKGPGQVRVLLERGRCHNSAGEREKATGIFKEALEAAKAISADYFTVDALHMLGISEPPEEALAWNLQAIEAAENAKSERARKWRGTLYNNTGWTYFEKKQYEKALTLFRSNVAFREEADADNKFARWSEGKALRLLKRYKEALKIQRALEVRYEREKSEDGFVFEELAELLWATGDKTAAKPYFLKAYEALGKIDWMKSETERMDSIRERAGLPKPKAEAKSDDDAATKDDAPKADDAETDGE